MVKAGLGVNQKEQLTSFIYNYTASVRKERCDSEYETIAKLYISHGKAIRQAEKVNAALIDLITALQTSTSRDFNEKATNKLCKEAVDLIEIGLYLLTVGLKHQA